MTTHKPILSRGTLRQANVIVTAGIILLLVGCTLPANLPPALAGFLGVQGDTIRCEDIRLGILIGAEDDPIAQEQRDGYELALQQINANGGVAGCDLQLSYQAEAAEGNTRQTYLAVRGLVEEDKVIAFVGGTSSPASMYAASLANYFGIPVIIPSAGGAHILPGENLWAFRLHAAEDEYANLVFEMIATEMGKNTRVAVVFEDTTFGNDAAIAAVNAINQNTLKVAGYEAYNAAKSSYSLLADAVAASGAQVVYLVFSTPSQASNILEGFKQLESLPKFVWVARAGGFATQAALLDPAAGLVDPAWTTLLVTRWPENSENDLEDPFLAAYARYTRAQYGAERIPSQYTAEAYKSLLIAARALESALETEPGFRQGIQQLRESMRQVLFNYKENSPLWGAIDFSNGGQNLEDLALLQLISEEWVVVFPPARAEAEPQGLLPAP